MNPVDRDDFVHALGQTMEFYNKTLEKHQVSFWITVCRDIPVAKLKAALLEYVKVGKFAPKPAHIIELADMCSQQNRAALPPPEDNTTSCPPDIANAWLWFTKFICIGARNPHMRKQASELPKIDAETQERYLLIVNQEAKRYKIPEAIPDEYKLESVWR